MTNNKMTYCNPLPLPDMDQGYYDTELPDYLNDYRCAADATVIYDEGTWYMYSTSSRRIYSSTDGTNWEAHKVDNLLGAAPGVVKHRGRYYLMINNTDMNLYVADTPLGEFVSLGPIHTEDGETLSPVDTAFFSEGNNLYLYWGCGQEKIFGAKMSNDDPTLIEGDIKTLIEFHPEHEWERWGAYNHCKYKGWIEGAHMYSKNGKYYLIYSAAGTEFSSYAMGVYVSDSPLGDFTYQSKNPLIRGKDGVVMGCGHGCIVDGPNDTIWVFYTCIISALHKYERRIGMDRVFIDQEGNLICGSPTGVPQWSPVVPDDKLSDLGLFNLTALAFPNVSSCKNTMLPVFATDENPKSWWQPDDNDNHPFITIPLSGPFEVSAVRIIWRELNLDYNKGITPKPISYVIEGKTLLGETVIFFDCSKNTDDLCCDYREFIPTNCIEVTLRFVKPEYYSLGVIDFSVFGKSSDQNIEDEYGISAESISPSPCYYNF